MTIFPGTGLMNVIVSREMLKYLKERKLQGPTAFFFFFKVSFLFKEHFRLKIECRGKKLICKNQEKCWVFCLFY